MPIYKQSVNVRQITLVRHLVNFSELCWHCVLLRCWQ